MGIVSNHLWNLDEIVMSLGLKKYFDCIISSAQVGYRKPHPEIYKLALSKINAQKKDVIFIGDDFQNDYEGPNKIGIDAILIDRGRTNECKHSIKSLVEITDKL